MEIHSFLIQTLIFLAAAVIAVPISKRLGMGSVLGYLIAGSIIGPWCLGLISNVENISKFSEFGVVLLLFIIGLESNPKHLWSTRKDVFGLGTLQVALTTVLFTPIVYSAGLPWLPATLAAFGLSLSSTAFALQSLSEKNQLNTTFGKKAFSILLFQDLVVIPFLAIVPFLGPAQANQESPAVAMGKALGVIILVIVVGRLLLRYMFRFIASSKSREIFTSAGLLIVLGVAALMEHVGVSMALGAFLAGMLLAESEYRHELEADVEPFKGLLLGLFFTAVGMSINYGLIIKNPLLIVTAAAGVVLLKAGVVYFLGRKSQLNHKGSLAMALALPQGGEFAFVLFSMLVVRGLLTTDLKDSLIAVVALSMGLTPVISFLNDRVSSRAKDQSQEFDTINEANPVIIAGFGRVGQIPGRILRALDIPFTALELDSEQVDAVRKFGNKIYFGDASRVDLLDAAKADQAKIFILAIDDMEASVRTAQMVRERYPHLKILARARNRQHAFELMDLGIKVIYRETLASSLELTAVMLKELGYEEKDIQHKLAKFREHDERTLFSQHKMKDNEKLLISYSKEATKLLEDLFKTDKI